MRFRIRNQIIELIPTIIEGIKFFQNTDDVTALEVLDECTNGVISIFNTLDKELSEDKLYTYVDIISPIIELINEMKQLECKEKSKYIFEVEKLLNLLKENLLKENEVKLEVLFLPYKASMWDSLESIWRAANDDPRCNCNVVPIPYYDRNSNQTLGAFHYEGDKLPKDIPIVNYDNYDISINKPDVIYIHNPYDEKNAVTIVDQRYFSYNLKRHTEMLVYVPYFVTNGLFPESQSKIISMNSATRVIIQSEQVKEQLLKYNDTKKLLALGSPKIDKIIYLEKNKPEVPEKWRKIIKGKKVVLYNTSISSLLEHDEKFIKKLKYVFSCFETRDDVVLLWRPHPLSKATISSMRPQLINQYEKLIKDFKNREIGIFDDTADVERAIAISDAYYGDGGSSIVTMYGITGKPIFVQHYDYIREPNPGEVQSVWFSDVEFDGEYGWFSAGPFNGLCKVNLNTGETKIISEIPNERKSGVYLYNGIKKIDDKLILTPLNANEIAIYNIETKEFIKISPNQGNNQHSYLLKSAICNEYIYMTPHKFRPIIRYDLKTREIKSYSDCLKVLRNPSFDINKPLFYDCVQIKEDILLMPCAQDNKILEFNIKTETTKLHTVGKSGNNYISITYDGTNCWLIQNECKKQESIVRWNYDTGKTDEFYNYPDGFSGSRGFFRRIVHCGNYLLAFPRFSNMIVKIDILSGKMTELKTNFEYREGQRKSDYHNMESNYIFAKTYNDNYIIAISMYDSSLIKININTEEATKVKLKIDENMNSYVDFDSYINESSPIHYYYSENKYLTLNKYLNYIASDKYCLDIYQKRVYSSIFENSDGSSGKKIHECVINEFRYEENLW